jgi:hypothetical protein
MPSGPDPMGGNWFFRKDHAQTKKDEITIRSNRIVI